MTQPPEDPRRPEHPQGNPGQDNPSTRPIEETAATEAYSDPGYQQPYYDGPQYEHQPPQYGSGQYAHDPYAQQPPKKSSSGRTIGLALAALAALVVVGVIAIVVIRGGGAGSDEVAGGGAASSTTTTTTSASPTTTSTTEETTTTTTRTTPSGRVVYQLTGGGEVVGLRWTSNGSDEVLAATGTPWSQSTVVAGGTASVSAIVVRGPVTCSIMVDGEQVSTQTSNGGLVRCSAAVG